MSQRDWSSFRHAILVAGHSVLLDPTRPELDESWALLDFQRGEPLKYIGHVRSAVEMAAQDPSALLVFSGGQTRVAAGPRSEAASYHAVAERLHWWGAPGVATRATTEEFARDSFENLLFGLCRFRECVGAYPERLTVVSWLFKEERFGMHRDAIRFPPGRFRYVGANDPDRIDQALASERSARDRYRADPYSHSPAFQEKRRDRNPFRRQHGYFTSCPELTPLLLHAGPALYTGPVPWPA